MKKVSFSWRAFISLGLFAAFLMLFVSGIILYLAPPGRVANWTNWQLLGLSKHDWQNQHTIFSLAFAILSIFHLFSINWKAFWSYIVAKTHAGLGKPLELSGILLLALLIGIGTQLNVQPFSAVIDLGESLSASWEEPASRPPVPHTEKLTLREISIKFTMGTSPEELREKLEKQGFAIQSLDQTLESIGAENNASPEEVYKLLEITSPGKSGKGRGQGRNRQ